MEKRMNHINIMFRTLVWLRFEIYLDFYDVSPF